MKTIIACLATACFAVPAVAQPPSETPPEVAELIAGIVEDTGVTPFGQTFLRELDDAESETVEVAVAPDKLTYVQLMGNEYTNAIWVHASAGGREIAMSKADKGDPVLQIPAGNGNKVSLKIEMNCGYAVCQYFIQTFVR